MNRTLIVCAFIVVSAAQMPADAARQHRDEDVSFQSGANTLASASCRILSGECGHCAG